MCFLLLILRRNAFTVYRRNSYSLSHKVVGWLMLIPYSEKVIRLNLQ